jgi:translocation and assembly module TamB
MTQPAFPEPVSPPPRRNRRWRKLLFIFSLLAVAGVAGGAWWVWVFVQEKLAPLVAETLGRDLSRPVQVGRLQRVSFNSMRFGPSAIPATATDPDRAKVEAVEVQFDPWKVLWQRRLPLYITLVKPEVFLEQDSKGLWVNTEIKAQPGKSAIEVQLAQLRFADAQVELLAQPKPEGKRRSVRLKQVQGFVNILEKNRRFTYEVIGESVAKGDFRIRGDSKRVTDKALLSKLNLEGNNFLVSEVDRLIRLPVDITAGRTNGKVDVTINPDTTYQLLGKATLNKVGLVSKGAPKPITEATGEIELENQTVRLKNLKAKFGDLFLVANGSIDPKRGFDLKANLPAVEIPRFIKTFQLKTPVPVIGTVAANVTLTGPFSTPTIAGTVENIGFVTVDRLALDQVKSQFRLDVAQKRLDIANLDVIPKVGGRVTGGGTIGLDIPQTVNLALQANGLPADTIAKVYNTPVSAFEIGGVNAQINVKGNVNNIVTTAVWQAPKATYPAQGEVVIAQNGQRIDLRRLQADVYGGRISGTGQLIDRAWQADVNLAGIQLAQANPQLRGLADGNVKLRGNLNNPNAAGVIAEGQVRLSEGIAVITKAITADFNWDGRQINLKSATAPGLNASGVIFAKLDGTPEITGLDLRAQVQDLALSALAIKGPEGVEVVGNADFDGQILGTPTQPQIKGKLGLFDFAVNGIAFEPLQGSVNITPNQGLNLNLAGNRDRLILSLNAQNQPLSVDVQRGELGIVGKAQGELFNVVLSQIPLNELSAFGISIPNLTGTLSGNASINLAKLEVPTATLTIDQPQFGQFPTAFQSQQIKTQVSYINGVARGNIFVTRPRFGTIDSTDASTNFVFANNVLRISDFTVQKGNSRFTVAGLLDLRSSPRLEGEVKVSKGRVEDILGALQIFELTDLTRGMNLPAYGNSATLANLKVGGSTQSQVSLKTQLERLAEVNTRIRQITQERKSLLRSIPGEDRTEAILPQFADIRGDFDSKIRFNASLKGVNVDEFEVNASNLEWRPFPSYPEFQKIGQRTLVRQRDNEILQIQSLFIDASYKDGILDLTRALAQIGESQINLQLNYGGENTTGQLKVDRLPLTEIRKFYPFPVPIVGELNVNANLGGTKTDPSATGFISLKEAAINGNGIETASSIFGYKQGRLNLDTKIKIENNPELLTLVGEVPLPIPFINVIPEDDNIDLKINVKNEGLALLNLFGTPVTWQSGEGQVNLTIGGKLFSPTANGEIVLKNASFLTQGLPEPLTNVNGTIRFDQDKVRVESLNGAFSKGNVAAKGSLPLFNLLASLPIPLGVSNQACLSEDANQPLNIEMNQILLSYKGLYRGNVQGCVNVAGNLFQPKVTGEITLSNGQVLLSDELTQTPTNSGDGAGDGAGDGIGNPNATGLEFDNLRLTLGNNIQIVRAPIINFVARGTLTVNGSLNAPRPIGRILLKSGQVNIFTTQFVLARGYTHTAIFAPEQGLDPILDVRMIASVPEVTRNPIVNPQTITSEVNDSPLLTTNLGSLQTVRIQAKVTGRASELFDNLELTSSPSRTQNEIIGLLGGGFVNTLGRGDSTLGIANLAGSALLTNIQGFIGNALGLSEFRLFPTISTDDEKRSSTLGLAAEIGVDITPSVSASISKILTSNQLPQIGLNYRINDNFLFRGSTDFFEDSRVVIEYEARF